MKLKHIRSFGFKTFAEPTTLEFGNGVTAIVGPNGSGKSNLVDAFRWVLGETSSKSLRGRALEDVIFSGNEMRKPLGIAEVSILFDNADRQVADRLRRGRDHAPRLSRRRKRILHQPRASTAARHFGSVDGHRPWTGLVCDRLAGSDRRDSYEQTRGTPRALRRDGRHRQISLAQARIDAASGTDRAERDSHQRPDRRTRAARPRAGDADAASAAISSGEHARSRPRDPRLPARQRDPASRVRDAARGDRRKTRSARRGRSESRVARRRSRRELRTQLYRCELQLEELRSQAQSEAQRSRRDSRRSTPPRLRAGKRSSAIDADIAGRCDASARARIAGRSDRGAAKSGSRRSRGRSKRRANANWRPRQRSPGRTRTSTRIFTRCARSSPALPQLAARKAERRVQAQSLRAEAERLETEERAARERAEQIEIAAGGASHVTTSAGVNSRVARKSSLDARGAPRMPSAMRRLRSKKSRARSPRTATNRSKSRPPNHAFTPSRSWKIRSRVTFPVLAPSSKRGSAASSAASKASSRISSRPTNGTRGQWT